MHFDTSTALLTGIALTVAVAAVLLYASRSLTPGLRELMLLWIGGLCLEPLALTFALTSVHAPLILLSNVVHAAAFALMGVAMARFLGHPPRHSRLWLIAWVAVNTVLLAMIHPAEHLRLVLNALPFAALQFMVAAPVLRRARPLRPADFITAAAFLVCAGLTIVRGGVNLLAVFGWENASVDAMAEAVFLVNAMLPMLGTIGFMLMCGERLGDDLRRMAMQDPLTGAHNRLSLTRMAEPAIAEALSGGRPVSLLTIDIDHFKRVNDEHGHEVGDRVLVELADSMRWELGPGYPLCRIGGEEFVALLQGVAEAEALVIAERVRASVAASPVCGAHGIAMQVSIGVAEAGADIGDLKTLLRRADQALYIAKNSGRNRCVTASAGRHPVVVAV